MSRVPFLGALAVAAILATAVPAAAQILTSTQDRMTHGKPSKSDVARSDAVLRRTADCVAKRAPTRIESLLRTAPGSPTESTILSSFQSRLDWCIPGEDSIGFPWTLLRGALVEALYKAQFPELLPAAPAAPPEALAAWAAPNLTSGGKVELEYFHGVARCVVARNPQLVGKLIATTPMAADEVAALRPIRALLPGCIESGISFTASRESLRGLLAEALLRYRRDQRDGFAAAAAIPAGKN
jgi:hypothetical protein